jgi:outer membrane protein
VGSISKVLVGLVLCSVSVVSFAQGKVVILDVQAAMLSTELAKKELAKLDKNPEFASMKAKLDGLVADIKKLQATAEKDAMTWSAEQQAEHRKKVEYLRADYELAGKKLQAEQQAVVQLVMQQLGPKTRTVLDQLIASDNIGLVLNSQAAIHASPAFDITSKLTDLLNKAK